MFVVETVRNLQIGGSVSPRIRPLSVYQPHGSMRALVMDQSELNQVHLKKRAPIVEYKKPVKKDSHIVDFRASLRKTRPVIRKQSPNMVNASGVFDFRANLKPRTSVKKNVPLDNDNDVESVKVVAQRKNTGGPPPFDPLLLASMSLGTDIKKLKETVIDIAPPNNQRGLPVYNPITTPVLSIIDSTDSNMNEAVSSPKQLPPNPVEAIDSADLQKQKDNDLILLSFQNFEDGMAQFDEEIEFKQSFAETLVSQIMELAENGKILKAGVYADTVRKQCKLVMKAVREHSQRLQKFNENMQTLYSQVFNIYYFMYYLYYFVC